MSQSEKCPFLEIDDFNDQYYCKARVHYEELAPHIAKLCKSSLHKTCSDYQAAIGGVMIKTTSDVLNCILISMNYK